MVDTLRPEQRSARMALVRSKDTRPERMVRSLAHGLGYRFRLHSRELPGHPDLVFASRHKVVFVHGCFWHRHPGCRLARLPKSRLDFWLPKLAENRRRDLRSQRQLSTMGWSSLVIWECQVRNKSRLAARLQRFLGVRA